MDSKRGIQKGGGREDAAVLYESLIDVENVETSYFDNCAFLATLASFLPVLSHPSVHLNE